ncbi:inosine guanosine and xanthosine phosphorylase family [Desulfobulbus propionicus DSM 2032]|jgi:purine-nucleoside phosphorylase|uniref:Purine nucleoside phosphorylase n=1 Tax=Desulfobulbus propionicus (strain ATCC 33891 / DSM 2032 / VKM B-1956 / 1pr3) TaxID=577650 RepID=A0A7U3YKL7_DESPD|nr:purine-nucleoside phosphorylase [Desulfobulbus propionicus]ADW17065.1 inosine guanosine and xanthosine phosphorylase family [Desulfobulbus propionicus DSM 2032]
MIDIDRHRHEVETAVAFLRERISAPPEVLIQLGTGLGELVRAMEVECTLAYEAIPHFPRSTVTSHAGNLVIGRLAGKRAAILQGRFHCYEGYSAREVAFPIRVLALLGAKTAIITNASGGLNPAFQPGTIMVLNDHLNLLGDNPLRGPNVDAWGVRFPDLSTPYAPELRDLALSLAERLHRAEVTSGTYVCIPGPSLETPAETRFLRLIGADAVGMSSVPEILVALHAGLRVLGLSVVANVNDPDHFQPILLDDIIAAARRAEPRLQQLIIHILAELTP